MNYYESSVSKNQLDSDGFSDTSNDWVLNCGKQGMFFVLCVSFCVLICLFVCTCDTNIDNIDVACTQKYSSKEFSLSEYLSWKYTKIAVEWCEECTKWVLSLQEKIHISLQPL